MTYWQWLRKLRVGPPCFLWEVGLIEAILSVLLGGTSVVLGLILTGWGHLLIPGGLSVGFFGYTHGYWRDFHKDE